MRISFKKRCSIFPSPKEAYRYRVKTINKYNNQVCLQNCTDNKLIDRPTMGKTQRDQPFNKERGQAPGGTQNRSQIRRAKWWWWREQGSGMYAPASGAPALRHSADPLCSLCGIRGSQFKRVRMPHFLCTRRQEVCPHARNPLLLLPFGVLEQWGVTRTAPSAWDSIHASCYILFVFCELIIASNIL